jgi:hypothetical protein
MINGISAHYPCTAEAILMASKTDEIEARYILH